MYNAAPFAQMDGNNNGQRRLRSEQGAETRGAGEIIIAAAAVREEQQALMQPGDAPVTPGHGE